MTTKHHFRFGMQIRAAGTRREWAEKVRKTEALGYDILLTPDHIGERFAYAPALTAAAAATTTLRLGTLVLDNDFRHPALLAAEAATLDLLSDGRFELGMGAGWMGDDYTISGIPFDSPAVRVGRLEEAVHIIKDSFGDAPVTHHGEHFTINGLVGYPRPVQQPHPPILLGAGGKRMLAIAAREADIVGLISPGLRQDGLPDVSGETVAKQVAYLRECAGERADEIELNILLQRLVVTDNTQSALDEVSREWGIAVETLRESPCVLIGSTDQIVDTLRCRRERYGISYYVTRDLHMEEFAPVVSALGGV